MFWSSHLIRPPFLRSWSASRTETSLQTAVVLQTSTVELFTAWKKLQKYLLATNQVENLKKVEGLQHHRGQEHVLRLEDNFHRNNPILVLPVCLGLLWFHYPQSTHCTLVRITRGNLAWDREVFLHPAPILHHLCDSYNSSLALHCKLQFNLLQIHLIRHTPKARVCLLVKVPVQNVSMKKIGIVSTWRSPSSKVQWRLRGGRGRGGGSGPQASPEYHGDLLAHE